jgi:glycosyltransferase involved in cell wall biosynthesis
LRDTDDGSCHPAPWITELAEEIKNKVDLTIINYSHQSEKEVDEFERDGIHFVFIRTPRFRYDLLTLYRLRLKWFLDYLSKKRCDFDLIHVHGTEHQYEYIAERLGVPYIISIQGIINLCRPFYTNKLSPMYVGWYLTSGHEKTGIKKAKYFFCRTHWDTQFVKELNPEAEIFHNWEIIREDFFEDLHNPASRTLVFMGGTSLFKGIREALRCLYVLKSEGIKFRLQICGRGQWGEISPFVKENCLNIDREDIEFLGFLTAKELSVVFRNSFCLLHPSYMDNSPNSVCEAQVAGLPVVASNVGGVSSLIEDGKTGLLVKRYDYKNLANQVMRLTNDKNLYESISQNARTVARKRHHRDTIVSKTLDAYAFVMNSRSI